MSIPLNTKHFIKEASIRNTNFPNNPNPFSSSSINISKFPPMTLSFTKWTSSQASINSESSDEKTNLPPQMSPQAVSFQCQHNKKNFPIPPPPELVIKPPAHSFSPIHPNPRLKKAALTNLI
ncbi:hypothetical protein O181_065999 [Austropuccinia psidii MF-1]|uniref:Uncharacterized protein n=1 Tax=Austropuccinia psidii MF-1 TaxID=1389203 RepID=A0A9Q3I538_9BASI|nr:hypothetical protein [Austropuccinia psidii MF-1]